eukprot:COSAG01_NODE_16010_length_1278_cov_25.457167_1_plen_195_part_00
MRLAARSLSRTRCFGTTMLIPQDSTLTPIREGPYTWKEARSESTIRALRTILQPRGSMFTYCTSRLLSRQILEYFTPSLHRCPRGAPFLLVVLLLVATKTNALLACYASIHATRHGVSNALLARSATTVSCASRVMRVSDQPQIKLLARLVREQITPLQVSASCVQSQPWSHQIIHSATSVTQESTQTCRETNV